MRSSLIEILIKSTKLNYLKRFVTSVSAFIEYMLHSTHGSTTSMDKILIYENRYLFIVVSTHLMSKHPPVKYILP